MEAPRYDAAVGNSPEYNSQMPVYTPGDAGCGKVVAVLAVIIAAFFILLLIVNPPHF